MKVGLVQYAPEWENIQGNIKLVEKLIEKSSRDHEVLIFPEMSLTGFTMNSENFAEDVDGETTKFFISMAKKSKKHIFAGLIEKNDAGIFNSLVHFDKNGIVGARYRKVHPFKEEKDHFNASDRPLISRIDHYKVGLSICYDLRFPELYRHYAKEGAEIMINIANWPIDRIEHWKVLLQARAIENQCYMIGVNRIGQDNQYTYSGSSAVYGPMGEELLLAPNQDKVFSVNLELNKVEKARETLPFLKDMKLA